MKIGFKLTSFLFCTIFLFSCEEWEDTKVPYINEDMEMVYLQMELGDPERGYEVYFKDLIKDWSPYNDLDILLSNGFSAKLVDIIDIENNFESLFDLGNNITINPYVELPSHNKILENLQENMIVKFEPMKGYLDIVPTSGGTTYHSLYSIDFIFHENPNRDINFDYYPHRNKKQNDGFDIYSYSIVYTIDKGEVYGGYYTNTVFEHIVLDKINNRLEIWLNPIEDIAFTTTNALTGSQVAHIINTGVEGTDYEIYPWSGYNTYKIGENLYIPSIYNTYRYIGTTNFNGSIRYLHRSQFVMFFEFL